VLPDRASRHPFFAYLLSREPFPLCVFWIVSQRFMQRQQGVHSFG
jgi:hypothetical protein